MGTKSSANKTIYHVGTIGYSPAFKMGHIHLTEMSQNKGFFPKAVCDINPDCLKAAERDFPGIETYSSLDVMLRKSEVDLLAIILPHDVHYSAAMKCLNAGKHVVLEKPFAITVDECEKMSALARRKKLLLSTYHNRHWDGNILTIKKVLPEIGRPFRWESFQGGYSEPRDWWRSDKKISGGIIYDWGAHFMEWMLQVMPYEMTEISGFQVKEVWDKVTNEDELTAIVRFGKDAMAMHTVSHVALAGKDMIKIWGTKGAITATHHSVTLHTRDKSGQTVSTNIAMEKSAGYKYYQNVHGHLFKGEPLIITPEHATRVIQILDYAGRSAGQNKSLRARLA